MDTFFRPWHWPDLDAEGREIWPNEAKFKTWDFCANSAEPPEGLPQNQGLFTR